MVQQDVLLTHHRKDVVEFLCSDGAFIDEVLLRPRQKVGGLSAVGFALQFRQRQSRQTEQIVEAEGAINFVEVLLLNGESLHQHFHHVVRHLIGNFQPHHFAADPAFAQAFLQRQHQIVGLQIPQLQIGITGDAEEVVALHRHAREEQREIEGNHLLQRNGAVDRRRIVIAQLRWDGHEAREVLLRNLHPGKLSLIRFWITDHSRHVHAQVADERERVGWIHRQRSQHREDRAAEGVVDPLTLSFVQLVVIQQLHPVFLELLFEVQSKVVLLLLKQRHQLFADGQQLFQRRLAVFAGFGDAGFHLRLQGCHTHHEKFVEVVAEDGAEFRLIQQRSALIKCLSEDSLVEGDPAQFAVDVAIRTQHIGTHGMAGGTVVVRSAT